MKEEWKKDHPIRMHESQLDKARDIIFLFLDAGFKDIEVSYYVPQDDTRNTTKAK